MDSCVKKWIMILGVVILLFSYSSGADSLLVPVQDLVVIYPPEGNPDSSIGLRFLVRFDIPDSLSDYRITYAEAILPFHITQYRDTSFSTELYAITTAWDDDSVSWDFPWMNPGGDMNSSLVFSRFFTMGQIEMINFNLTSIVGEWVNNSIPNNGFMIIVYYPDSRAFRFNVAPLLPYIRSNMYLIVKYH